MPDTGPPPWPLAKHSDGSPDPIGIPGWLKSHPELRRRGIVLSETLKPSYVFATNWRDQSVAAYAVKLLEPGTDEAAIYERLSQDTTSSNPCIPCEVVRSGQPDLLIMPHIYEINCVNYMKLSLSSVLGMFLQIVEGIEYLHARHIAHLAILNLFQDVCVGNTLIAFEQQVRLDPRLVTNKVYIIDFHTSRQLDFGPGHQHAVPITVSQVKPPSGLKHFDPYSWDVYCLSDLWGYMMKMKYYFTGPPPWVALRINRWLIGSERGCTGPCHCRPTARRVRQVLTIVRWAICVAELAVWPFHRITALYRKT
ncbi:hypothetical protein C8Q78DRAFT_984975 [Trametes maxima]|nr:hypothetical protein C8Q78DRAFT_984975 [Trametes maxima]